MTVPDPDAARPMAATEVATPSGRAPAIILLHGAFLNREVWAGYDAILGPGYRTLALDMTPGRAAHGAPFRLPDAVERIASTIRDECGGSAIVVGYSLGGYAGLATAAAHPDLVRGLVLLDASTPPRVFTTTLGLGLLVLGIVPRPISSAVLRAVLSHLSAEAWDRIARAGVDARAGASAVRELHAMNYWRAVRRYPGPMLVLNGSTDWLFRATEARTVLAARDARLTLIHGAGHLAPIEMPTQVGGAIRRFADSLAPAG